MVRIDYTYLIHRIYTYRYSIKLQIIPGQNFNFSLIALLPTISLGQNHFILSAGRNTSRSTPVKCDGTGFESFSWPFFLSTNLELLHT